MSGKMTVKEYRSKVDRRTEKLRESIEETIEEIEETAEKVENEDIDIAERVLSPITSEDIRYYNFRRRKPPETFEHMKKLNRAGIYPQSYHDIDINLDISFETGFVPENRAFWNLGANELLQFANEEISDRRSGKTDFLEAVLEEPGNIRADTAIRWFDERDEVDFDEFNSNLTEDGTVLGLGYNEKIMEQTIQEYWGEIRNNAQIDNLERVRRGLALDMVKTLQGLALNKENPEMYNEQLADFESFFRNFQPEFYNEIFENNHEYRIRPINQENESIAACKAVGSCLRNKPFNEAHWMYARDPFTFVQAVGKDGEINGYVRSFVMEDDDGNDFLGIDTLEVPKSAGVEIEDYRDDFESEKDTLKAGALGAIKLAISLNLDYVAAKDARVRFGLRESYSNTSREIKYRKHGETVPYYSVVKAQFSEEEDRFIYPEEEFKGEIEKGKMPGFAVYHKPGEQEVRGFQTEPGWHQHESYILFENPSNFTSQNID